MPIRPENLARYPSDWPALSVAMKEAAGWRCAGEGECGRGTHEGRCPNRHGEAAYGTGSRVVLTTAHLDHTPENCDPANLRPMCQGCHLHYDKDHHRETAAATRRARIAAAGQLALLDEQMEVADDEPRCALESSLSATCYCTGRPGCQMQHDEDNDYDPDYDDDVIARPVETVELPGVSR